MEMIEVKTAELVGPALDWAVAQADGQEVALICPPIIDENNWPALLLNKNRWLLFGEPAKFWLPSTDWSQGGPLIEKYLIAFCVEHEDVILAVLCDDYGMYVSGWRQGEKHLIAACRAIVAAKLGDTVRVPAPLLEVVV